MLRLSVCVLEITQKQHSHSHIHVNTMAVTAPGSGLEGGHAHGELEAHGGCGEKYGSCVRKNDGRRDNRARVRWCASGVQGRSGGRTASWGPGRGSYPIVFGWISETTRNVAISRKGKPPKESRYFSRARMRNRHNGLDGKKYPFNCMIALRGH
jgi:hypothetical protein